jgi:hypothetical protein
MPNEDVALTLDEAVAEVMGLLTGLDLELVPELDRYQAITRQLNRALRAVALESEWSYYSSTENLGPVHAGDRSVVMRASVRPRIIGNDSCRLVNPATKQVIEWVAFVPRDSLYTYAWQRGLWASHTGTRIDLSRPIFQNEDGWEFHIPVMREPSMFRLPPKPEDPNAEPEEVPEDVREQLVDFDFPDLVVRKAAYFYAQTNPTWQPRVQTLEANYKELLYPLVERDTRHTDAPPQNTWQLGIEGDATGTSLMPTRPSADWERLF